MIDVLKYFTTAKKCCRDRLVQISDFVLKVLPLWAGKRNPSTFKVEFVETASTSGSV